MSTSPDPVDPPRAAPAVPPLAQPVDDAPPPTGAAASASSPAAAPPVPDDEAPASVPPAAALPAGPAGLAGSGARAGAWRWLALAALVVALAAVAWAYQLQQRLRASEQEFARRQREAAAQIIESRTLARAADAGMRDLGAKLALLEARVAENAMQRSQVEDLMQSLSRSRDENVLADIDAALRVAQQQAAITGGVDPLLTALKQADERLTRLQQPRLERVRRAVLQDLERVRAAGTVDLNSLALRLDEITRQVDELPLLAVAGAVAPRAAAAAAAGTAAPSAAQTRQAPRDTGWMADFQAFMGHVWAETRQLVRVTRIEHPEAGLLAPEQTVYLRENLRLQLLNARLSLLSRQFDAAQAGLKQAQALIDRYFDRQSRRVALVSEQIRQTAAQARQVVVPRPDATLAALATASGGR